MKALIGLSLLSALCLPDSNSGSDPTTLPTGRYVEARTASVFAGACHYGGEYTTSGRRAVMAWSFESGVVDGVDLEGLSLAAVVSSKVNLAEEKKHRSVLVFPTQLNAKQEAALRKAVVEREPELFGEIVETRRERFTLKFVKDRYQLELGEFAQLDGELMPDRACCHMPSNVWYQPLWDDVANPIVGCSAKFRVNLEKLSPRFERRGDNDAFVGRFELKAPEKNANVEAQTCCSKK